MKTHRANVYLSKDGEFWGVLTCCGRAIGAEQVIKKGLIVRRPDTPSCRSCYRGPRKKESAPEAD